MYDNYNFPAGADTPDAPWNQSEPDDKDFLVDVEYVLQKKNVKVTTKDYKPEIVNKDEEIVEPLDTSDTNWEDAYNNSGHFTIQEMLDELKEYVKVMLKEPSRSGVICEDKPNGVYEYTSLIMPMLIQND